MPRIIVIRAGITGLSAAHRLMELSAEHGLPLEVAVLEGRVRPGGVISTREMGEFLAEEGPDSFLRSKPEALGLSIRAGLEPRIIGTSAEAGTLFVVRGGKLMPLPEGLFPAPTRMGALFNTPLLSMKGKIRMSLEPVIPRRGSRGDESAASFIRRRFGEEAYERMVQPLLPGKYAGDLETPSVRAALPGLAKMEEEYVSVKRRMRRNGAVWGARKDGKEGNGERFAFDRGLGTLINTVVSRLPEDSVMQKSRVKRIDPAGEGFIIHLSGGNPIECDAVIAALASQAPLITGSLDLELSLGLSQIEYVSTIVINLAYHRSDVAHALDGSGFVVPSSEGIPLLACTFISVKPPGRGPEGTVLLRVIMGDSQNPVICRDDDQSLISSAHRVLSSPAVIKSPPSSNIVSRNPESMQHYAVGNEALVERIMERARRYPGLKLAGNAYDGVGIPDCVRSGEEAALEIFSYISKRETENEGNESRR
ncbi:MAG: protoporphyrinogen oxidase [Thermodesulfobacteriota bacterium]